MQIRQLGMDELESAYDVVRELRTSLSYDDFEDLVYAMRHQEYRMYGIFEDDRCVTFAGVCVQVSLEHGRHLLVCDLITRCECRSRGYGTEMLRYLGDTARMFQCGRLLLASGVRGPRVRAFLEKEGFAEAASLTFAKPV
jgi:GNAT superfamily N-acetyltransferase